MKISSLSLSLLTVLALTSCQSPTASVPADSDEQTPIHIEGDSASYLGADIQSWAMTNGTGGTIKEVGVTVPFSVIQAARTELREGEDPMVHDPDDSVRLTFPFAVSQATVVDHFDLDYNVVGHPPTPYALPHFDIHFYSITEADQMEINCSDMSIIAPDRLPSSFILTKPGLPPEGECVPMMGHHAVDITSPELAPENPEIFTKTMILGYYEGKPTFIEPMVSRDYLLSKQSFALSVPIPPIGLPAGKLYPRMFSATYDSSLDAYHFALSDFLEVEESDIMVEPLVGTGSLVK